MAARVGTLAWTAGLPLSPQRALRHSLVPATCSSHVILPSSVLPPRLLCGAVASSQAVAETPQPPSSSRSSSLAAKEEEGGPIQLPDSEDPFAAPSEGITPLQSAASILLTGTIAVLLYRSLRRRLKLAKETKVRSTGLQNIGQEIKKVATIDVTPEKVLTPVTKAPPSAWQTFQGAVVAGAIAFVLYKFATYVEAGFRSKPVSPVYTIRQLTITIRTIVNGLCYLATFVFAANSFGLTVYTLQLLMGGGPRETMEETGDRTSTDKDPLKTDSLEEVKKE